MKPYFDTNHVAGVLLLLVVLFGRGGIMGTLGRFSRG